MPATPLSAMVAFTKLAPPQASTPPPRLSAMVTLSALRVPDWPTSTTENELFAESSESSRWSVPSTTSAEPSLDASLIDTFAIVAETPWLTVTTSEESPPSIFEPRMTGPGDPPTGPAASGPSMVTFDPITSGASGAYTPGATWIVSPLWAFWT